MQKSAENKSANGGPWYYTGRGNDDGLIVALEGAP